MSYGTILTLSIIAKVEEKRERETERIKTPPVSSPKNLQKVLARIGRRDLSLLDAVGPKTRRRSFPPIKKKSLRYTTESRNWRYKASLPRKKRLP